MGAQDDDIEIVKLFIQRCNDHKVAEDETLAMFTDNASFHDPRFSAFEGKEAVAGFFKRLAQENQLIDALWTPINTFTERGQVCVQWEVINQRHMGSTEIFIEGCSIFRLRGGKIYYYRGYWNPMKATRKKALS